MPTPQWKQVVDHLKSFRVGTYEGYTSGGGYDNNTQFGRQFGENGVSWCVIFDWCVYDDCGLRTIVPKVDNVTVFSNWAKQRGQWSAYPSVGAWVNFSNGEHTELVTGFDATYVYTKGGNTNTNGSSQGDGVYEHTNLRKADKVTGYFAPRFPDGLCPPTADPADPRGGAALSSWKYGDALPYGQTDVPTSTAPYISLLQVAWAATNSMEMEKRVAPGDDNPQDDVLLVQNGLKKTVGIASDYNPGFFDGATGAAYRKWQESLYGAGSDSDGIPGLDSLTRLSIRSGLFRVRDTSGTYTPKFVEPAPDPTPVPVPVPTPTEPEWISFTQVLWAAQNSIDVERAQPAGDSNSQDDVLRVQAALKATVGIAEDHNPGFFDGATGIAYTKWQESLYGVGPDSDGLPGPDSLVKLGDRTKLFRVRDFPAAPAPSTAGKITTSQIDFTGKGAWSSGKSACENFIREACRIMGLDTRYWLPGMLTIASRETAYNSPDWQINTTDSNARNTSDLFGGGNAPDGYKAMCSRGMIQAIPQTFAAYHIAGTSVKIYDPVASAAAGINYIINVYKVSRDGSNLTARVQQADPSRSPRGY